MTNEIEQAIKDNAELIANETLADLIAVGGVVVYKRDKETEL